jgi:hypothetical protein
MFILLSDTICINCTLKTSGFKAKERCKKLVLNVWFCAHLQEIHCWCQKKVCSVNGLIMEGVLTTKGNTLSRTFCSDAKFKATLLSCPWTLLHGEMVSPPF